MLSEDRDMGVVQEICRAIQRNPKINRVTVCGREYDQIRDELEELTFLKWERPKYGTAIELLLWDNADEARRRATIKILGRPVECRAPGQ